MTVLHEAAVGGNDLTGCVRFRHLTCKLHNLGERSLGEFIARLQRLSPGLPVMDELEKFATIDTSMLKEAGADRWPAVLHLVPDYIRAGAASRHDIVRAALSSSGDDAA